MKDTSGVCSLALTETLAGSLGQSSVPSCLHCRARRAKWQVELLPEKCTHAGPLCLLLALSSPPVALLHLAFVRGRRCCNVLLLWQEKDWTHHTHIHTHSHQFSRSPLESKTQKLLISFFSGLFFLWLACLETEGGSKKEGRERWRQTGWGKACDW